MRRNKPRDLHVARRTTNPSPLERSALPVPVAQWPKRLITVVVARARCPQCGGFKFHRYRSLPNRPDGTALLWLQCLDEKCGYRFKLLQI